MALKKIVEVIFRGQSEKKEKLPGASKENTKKQSLKAWLVFVNFASDSLRGWNELCWNFHKVNSNISILTLDNF